MPIISGLDSAHLQIVLPLDQIVDFCRRWQISEFALFGSVLSNDFRPDSDIDVLLTFAPQAKRYLFDRDDMRQELITIFGRDVDIVERHLIERSRNYIRRKAILNSAAIVWEVSGYA